MSTIGLRFMVPLQCDAYSVISMAAIIRRLEETKQASSCMATSAYQKPLEFGSFCFAPAQLFLQ